VKERDSIGIEFWALAEDVEGNAADVETPEPEIGIVLEERKERVSNATSHLQHV